MKEGLSNLHTPSLSSSYNHKQKPSGKDWSSARVIDIILDENHPRFNELGGYSSIGTVIFQNLNSPNQDPNSTYNYASPLLSNTSFPLKNEIILIFNIPIEGNNVGSKSKYYYIGSINLWNSPHHNALPNNNDDLRKNIDKEGNIKLELTSEYYDGEFNERNNVNTLKNFPGDIIYQGRNGNSIRLGSTYQSEYNEWSKSGKNGDPILIIRNNYTNKDVSESWRPITENINTDESNIYLTSTQQLPIRYTYNYSSLPNQPIEPSQYNKPQILINSDRVLLNARKDGILINGEEFVHINSRNNIGLNSNYSITLNSNAINLGSVDAREQVVLGNKLMDSLTNLTDTLSNIMNVLSEIKEWPGGSPVPSPIGAAIDMLKPEVDALKQLYKGGSLLSKISKTN